MFIKILSTPHYSVMVFCSMEEVLTQQAKYIFIVTRNSGRYTPFFLALAEGIPPPLRGDVCQMVLMDHP